MIPPTFRNVPVVGAYWRGGMVCALVRAFEPGLGLDYCREPGNPHDANAIRVDADGIPTGYVSRANAAYMSAWMDAGIVYVVRVSRISPKRPWFIADFIPVRSDLPSEQVSRDTPLDADEGVPA